MDNTGKPITTQAEEDALTARIIDAPLVDLPKIVDEYNHHDLARMAERLEGTAIFILRKAEYLEYRCWHDLPHEEAVKKQNKLIARIRKVLTFFTTPDVHF